MFSRLSIFASFFWASNWIATHFFTHGRLWRFFFCFAVERIFELQNRLQKVTITRRPRSDSGTAGPPRLLELDLPFECLREINYQQLNEAAGECDARKYVEIPLRPGPNDLDAARGPNLLGRRRDWLRLNSVAAHDVDETRRNVGGIYAATVKIKWIKLTWLAWIIRTCMELRIVLRTAMSSWSIRSSTSLRIRRLIIRSN